VGAAPVSTPLGGLIAQQPDNRLTRIISVIVFILKIS